MSTRIVYLIKYRRDGERHEEQHYTWDEHTTRRIELADDPSASDIETGMGTEHVSDD